MSANLLSPIQAGLMHLIQLKKDLSSRAQRKLSEVNQRIAAVVADYVRLAHVHDFKDLHVPGYQTFTRRHDGQTEKANFYLIAMLSTGLLAVVLGTYFSTSSLVGQSPVLLFLGCALVAAVLVPIFAGIVRAVLRVDAEQRDSIKKAYVAIAAFGLLFLISLLEFAYIRFNSTHVTDVTLAIVIASIEISAILLAASFDCAFRYFNWSRRLDKKFRNLEDERKALEEKIAELSVEIQELEFRLNQTQSPTATPVTTTTTT